MLIQIRVQYAQALRQVSALQAQVKALETGSRSAGAAAGTMFSSRALQSMTAFGNKLQWTGRQLQNNFTLPLVVAGGFAVKWALDNEKAMTRVAKVYGDNTPAFNKLATKEIPALGRAFAALSSEFGVNQAAVINIGADWAAAGASGLALAKATKLTLQTMILGEMDATSATKALIAIQAQFGLTVDSNQKGVTTLSSVIDTLNMVENQTGASMSDLITVMSKSAGVARVAGIDVLHLAAFTAALVPAAGSAANAANGLKTIISRLGTPTSASAKLMLAMGINTASFAYQSLNGSQKIELMAKSFDKLSSSQQAQVSKQAAGLYQISRFDILMRDVVNVNGYYQRSLRAAGDETRNYQQKVKELNLVLDSNPQKLKIIGATLQNSMAAVIQPLLPIIVMLANSVAAAAMAFENLSPQVQKFILVGLLVLALIGPITKYLGSFITLFATMGRALEFAARGFLSLLKIFPLLWSGLVAIYEALQFVALAAWAAGSALVKGLAAVFAPLITVLASFVSLIGEWAVYIFYTISETVLAGLALIGAAIAEFAASVIARGLLYTISTAMVGLGEIVVAGFEAILVFTTRFWNGMILLMETGGKVLLAVMALVELGIAGIWETLQVMMRATWAATWAFFASIERMGAVLLVITEFGGMLLGYLAELGPAILAALASPWTWAVVAIGVAITAIIKHVKGGLGGIGTWFQSVFSSLGETFRPVVDFFRRAIEDIEKAFYSLPIGVQNAIKDVVNVVLAGAKEVYKLFSYLNPFAHHSPSLVENVTGGMNVVRNEHSKTAKSAVQHTSTIATAHAAVTNTMSVSNAKPNVTGPAYAALKTQGSNIAGVDTEITKATADLVKYKQVSKGLIPSQFADNLADVKKYLPQLLPIFNVLLADFAKLNVQLAAQKTLVDAQQAVVDKWAAALDAANTKLDTEQKKLDGLQKNLDNLTAEYQKHQDAMNNYANAPIQGMKAMSDAIFANSEAQKQLQLQILKWQDVNGSLDQIQSKMSSLAGDLEKLKGEAGDLRLAGAGSDVLKPINDQISQIQGQYDALNQTAQNSPIAQLQAQLTALQNTGQELQLTSDITFDPLTKQIQDLANAQQEMPFDQIIAGITTEKAAMDNLQPSIDAATAAVAAQTDVVNKATAARDAVQATYDAESKKLDALKTKYDAIAQSISDVTDALQAMGAAASKSGSAAASGGLGVAANVPAVGGSAQIGREGGMADQSAAIDKFVKDQQDAVTKSLGGFGDIFKPIKDGWNKFWTWAFGKDAVSPDRVNKFTGDITNGLSQGFAAQAGHITPIFQDTVKTIEEAFSGIGKVLKEVFGNKEVQNTLKTIGDVAATVAKGIGTVFMLIWPNIKSIFQTLESAFEKIFTKVLPTIEKFWKQVKPLVELLGILLVGAIKVVASVFSHTLGPVLNIVIGLIDSALNIIGGLIDFVVNIFSGKWSKAWGDVVQVFKAVWDGIYNIVGGFISLIIGGIEGFVNGIVGFFQWLYDILVGHSIIPDLVNMIITVFQWLTAPIRAVWDAIAAGVEAVWHGVIIPIFDGIKTYFKVWAAIFGWVWTNIIKPAWGLLWAGVSLGWKLTGKVLFTAIEAAIKVWAAIFGWVWNNVIKPAWNLIWSGASVIWTKVAVPVFNTAKTVIASLGTAFSAVKKVITDAWTAIWGAIKTTWDSVGKKIFEGIAGGFITIVNAAIHAINAIIDGVNAVSSLLHLGFTIKTIGTVPPPKFAQGGQLPWTQVGSGFKTNGPRAIVGEGRPAYPEYVIPTDPRYRNRASKLWKDAGHNIKMLSQGGSTEGSSGTQTAAAKVFNGNYPRGTITSAQIAADIKTAQEYNTHVWSDSRSVADQIGDDIMGALKVIGGVIAETGMKAVMIPVKAAADAFFNTVPIEVIKKMGLKFDATMYSKLTDIAKNKDSGNSTDPVGRWAPVAAEMTMKRHFGNDQNSGNMKRAIKDAAANVPAILARLSKESGGDPNAINNWDSNAAAGHPSKGLMQVIDPTYQSYASPFSASDIWDPRANMWAALGYAQSRYGSIGAGMNQPGGYFAGGILPAFAKGGIANRATAGVFGESGTEILAPLTPLWARLDKLEAQNAQILNGSKGGSTELHFHGNLVFPNIKSGDDAEEFIKNLETLAGS